jgi:hypothetical protein
LVPRRTGHTRKARLLTAVALFVIEIGHWGFSLVVPARTSGPTFVAGRPSKVFDTKYVEPNPARHCDVSPDGQRFLMLKESTARDPNLTPAPLWATSRNG